MRLFLALLLAMLSLVSRAKSEDCPNCPAPADRSIVIPGLSEQAKRLLMPAPTEQWSATMAQVENAPCRRKTPFSDSEMTSWIKTYGQDFMDGSAESRAIHGIMFKSESAALLDVFEKLVTHRHWLPERDASGQKTFKSACDKVTCAAAEIFGEKESTRLLFMLARFGYNGSHLAYPVASAWKPDELDDILLTLSDFPERTLPLEQMHQLTRHPRGATLAQLEKGGPAEYATGLIQVFDLWELSDRPKRQYAIAHEVAHNFGHVTRADESPDWSRLSLWEMTDVPLGDAINRRDEAGMPGAVTSDYGLKNRKEDWAEAAMAYRYNPSALKNRSPEKYQFLKEVIFDGLEYTSEESCREDRSLTVDLLSGALRRISGKKGSLRAALLDEADAHKGRFAYYPYLRTALTTRRLQNAKARTGVQTTTPAPAKPDRAPGMPQ